ncbi:hypothetical protein SFUMM280S_09774 [Streptomyces fumanus]
MSFSASIVVTVCRLRKLANRSSPEPSRVLAAFPNSSTLSPIASPLPSRLAAPVFSRSDRAPEELAPSGPSALLSSVMGENVVELVDLDRGAVAGGGQDGAVGEGEGRRGRPG